MNNETRFHLKVCLIAIVGGFAFGLSLIQPLKVLKQSSIINLIQNEVIDFY